MITRADRHRRTCGSDLAGEVDRTTNKYAGCFCTEYHNSVPDNAVVYAQAWVLPEDMLLPQVHTHKWNIETTPVRRSAFLRSDERQHAY